MKCNETKFTDSNLRKASEVELESDTQKCSQNFCLLRLSFYLCFSPWQIYCFRLITPSGTRTTSSTYAPLLSFESREKRTSLCQLILQIQEKAFDYSSWVIRAPPLDNGLPQTVKTVYNAGYVGSILGLGRFPGGGNGNPFQYSCLENPHGQKEPFRL